MKVIRKHESGLWALLENPDDPIKGPYFPTAEHAQYAALPEKAVVYEQDVTTRIEVLERTSIHVDSDLDYYVSFTFPDGSTDSYYIYGGGDTRTLGELFGNIQEMYDILWRERKP
jgi:hypothetical protein